MASTKVELAATMNAARDVALLDAALALAESDGFSKLSRSKVAASAGRGRSTVSFAFGTMDAFYDAVMGEAVKRRSLRVVAEGIALGHRVALAAPDDLKRQALESIAHAH